MSRKVDFELFPVCVVQLISTKLIPGGSRECHAQDMGVAVPDTIEYRKGHHRKEIHEASK